jgi:hypothetical protein
MNQAAIELAALRMLVVKVTAGHVAEVCKREDIAFRTALDRLLKAGERDIGEMPWVGLSDAQAAEANERVKVAYEALIDAVALGAS